LRKKKEVSEAGPRGMIVPYNYSTPRVRTKTNTAEGIINFGEKNDFPNILIDTIDNSPTGTACINRYIDFLKGDGLTNEDLSKHKANSNGDTFATLTEKICINFGTFRGAYILLRFSSNGKVSEVVSLPYESCRLGNRNEEDQITEILYNPYYGTKDQAAKKDFNVKYPVFNPAVVMDQIKKQKKDFKGQVLFLRKYQPGKPDYPIPEYYAGIDWFEVDAAKSQFHKNNVKNNFLLSVLLKVVGDPAALAPGADGKTVGEMLQADLKANLAGVENGGGMMVLWAKVKEAFPEVSAFPTNSNDKLFETLENIVTEQIARVTQVPPILANIQVAGKLGGTQEILNAADLLKNTVAGNQALIENVFNSIIFPIAEKSLLPTGESIEFTISPFTAITIVPDKLLEELTDTEKRELIGYPALEGEDDGRRRLLVDKIGVGGSATLLSILSSFTAGQMTWDQAFGTLKVLFGLKEKQIVSMLGEKPIEPTPATLV
jgi:hypothetical protein